MGVSGEASDAESVLSHLIEITLPSDLPFERTELLLTVDMIPLRKISSLCRPLVTIMVRLVRNSVRGI